MAGADAAGQGRAARPICRRPGARGKAQEAGRKRQDARPEASDAASRLLRHFLLMAPETRSRDTRSDASLWRRARRQGAGEEGEP